MSSFTFVHNADNDAHEEKEKDSTVVEPDNFVGRTVEEAGKILSELGRKLEHISRIDKDGKTLFTCDLCDKVFKHRQSAVQHSLIHSGIKPFQCTECAKTFRQRAHLIYHKRTHSGEHLYLQCSFCHKQFTTESSLRRHKKLFHCNTIENGEGNSTKHQEERGYVKMLENAEIEVILERLFTTHQGEQGKTYTCNECDKVFNHPQSAKNHSFIHSGRKPYKCSICGKGFRQIGHVKYHMRTHTGQHSYKCTQCDKTVTTKSSLKKHIRRLHDSNKEEKVPKEDNSNSNINRYEYKTDKSKFDKDYDVCFTCEILDGVKTLVCKICGKTFVHKLSARNHALIHSGNKPFQCSICDRTFRQRAHVIYHMRTHTENDRPFFCSICNKRFCTESSLERHNEITHMDEVYGEESADSNNRKGKKQLNSTNEIDFDACFEITTEKQIKKYSCKECGKVFTHQWSARNHALIHSGRKPYKCKICGKEFRQTSHMTYHMNTHARSQVYHCDICNKDYSNKGAFARHKQVNHDNVAIDTNPVSQSTAANNPNPISPNVVIVTNPDCSDEIETITGSNMTWKELSERLRAFRNDEEINENNNERSEKNQQENKTADTADETEPMETEGFYLLERSDEPDKIYIVHTSETDLFLPPELYPPTFATVSASDVGIELRPQNQNETPNNLQLRRENDPSSVKNSYLPAGANAVQLDGRVNEGRKEGEESKNKTTVSTSDISIEFLPHFQTESATNNKPIAKRQKILQEEDQDQESDDEDDDKMVVDFSNDENEYGTMADEVNTLTNTDTITPREMVETTSGKSRRSIIDSDEDLPFEVVVRKGEKRFLCKVCKKTFKQQWGAKLHALVHSGRKPYKCPDCNKAFRQVSHLAYHMDTHKRPNRFNCSNCKKTFISEGSLKRHFEMTHEVKATSDVENKASQVSQVETTTSYSMGEETEETESKGNCIFIVEVINGTKTLICKECGKSFTHQWSARNHGLIHSGMKPYNCTVCEKSFRQIGHLTYHMRTHSNDRPFKCSVCDKGFIDRSKMYTHERKAHRLQRPRSPVRKAVEGTDPDNAIDADYAIENRDGVRTFICKVCDKEFVHRYSLKNHSMIHSGRKPYKCAICNKEFRQRGHITYHMRTHTGEKRYQCSVCNKRYSTGGNLRKHKCIM